MKTDETIVQELQTATEGLLFMSETDAPFATIAWPGPDAPTPEAVRAWEGKPDAPCETDDLARMFYGSITEFPGLNDAGQERVRRFRRLLAALRENLTDICVSRVGGVQKDVYILGRSPNGKWLGLKTQVVET